MKQPVTLALADDVRAALDQLATQQDRSRSWVANRAIQEWLAARQQPAGAARDAPGSAAAGGFMT